MENENPVVEPQVEQPAEAENNQPTTPTVEELQAKLDKADEARRQLTARAKAEEEKRRNLEAELNKAKGEGGKSLDVEDYIDISASLEGLDGREKEYLAQQHKLTGRPLKEIRNDEDFLLWQSAYQSKVEKERALKPTSGQPETDKTRKLSEVLTDPNVPLSEKEELMKKYGLYKDPASAPPGQQRRVLIP